MPSAVAVRFFEGLRPTARRQYAMANGNATMKAFSDPQPIKRSVRVFIASASPLTREGLGAAARSVAPRRPGGLARDGCAEPGFFERPAQREAGGGNARANSIGPGGRPRCEREAERSTRPSRARTHHALVAASAIPKSLRVVLCDDAQTIRRSASPINI